MNNHGKSTVISIKPPHETLKGKKWQLIIYESQIQVKDEIHDTYDSCIYSLYKYVMCKQYKGLEIESIHDEYEDYRIPEEVR